MTVDEALWSATRGGVPSPCAADLGQRGLGARGDLVVLDAAARRTPRLSARDRPRRALVVRGGEVVVRAE